MAQLSPRQTQTSADLEPQYPVKTEILPGLERIRLPLSGALDHVNAWLLRDSGCSAIVDTGMSGAATIAFWEKQLAELQDAADRRLIVTHHHRDHAALTGWLAERWSSKVYMTTTEWLCGHYYHSLSPENYLRIANDYYRRAGCPDDVVKFALGIGASSYYGGYPSTIETLRDGTEIAIGAKTWKIITGSGHSPELACLYCAADAVLLVGDQVLPRITPLIPVVPSEPSANPLDDYLRSLDKFSSLPRDTLVLPSHGEPFSGLHDRIAEIREHHEKRLTLLRNSGSAAKSVWDCVGILFPRATDGYRALFATWETLAHIRYLEENGQARLISSDAGPACYQFD
jgi:glyoxylase-like metal-dependent hydrolase (beta-lactamase superfamily II)